MHFIFMLTRSDRTVEDGLAVLDAIEPVGLEYIGFKDVGVDKAILRDLAKRIHAMGARSYLEIVSATLEEHLASARTAKELGVDCLMGGTEVTEVLDVLDGSGIEYFPYPGKPKGHPVQLHGSSDVIAADCARFIERGCAGADLLAYRATDEDPVSLIRAARGSIGDSGRLIVAGDIKSPTMIQAVGDAGADAFTIGSAAFDGSFSTRKGLLASQLRDIVAACQ